MFKTTKLYDSIVIGGGPAGLSLGYQFTRCRDIDYAIVEKGSIGQSWRNMHDTLHLLSPMYVNQLPGFRFSVLRSFEKIPKEDFVRYLQRYAQKFGLNVLTGTTVDSVEKVGGRFRLKTSNGILEARTVVNATGYYSRPFLPNIERNDGSVKSIHSAEYKSPQELYRKGVVPGSRILIVGKRVSAGQLLEELFDAKFKLGISIRAEIETRRSGFSGWVKENLYYAKEYLQLMFQPNTKHDSLALMDGGRTDQIIQSGALATHGLIESIRDGRVFFADGKSEVYDLIVFATGYRACCSYLDDLVDTTRTLLDQQKNGRHTTVSGLYFLGLDNMISFKSRYVRGIASDSKLVAQDVSSYLRDYACGDVVSEG